MGALDLSLRPGDRVWLVARTLAAPAVCYTSPPGIVAAVEAGTPYLVVTVDGRDHRVHADNVRRTEPHRAERDRAVKPRRPMPDGFTEVTLW